MQQLQPWITPALVLGLFAWVRFTFRDPEDNTNDRLAATTNDMNQRFGHVNRRFDEVNGELAENRERMAKLEGSLEGFLAGRRDRDAA